MVCHYSRWWHGDWGFKSAATAWAIDMLMTCCEIAFSSRISGASEYNAFSSHDEQKLLMVCVGILGAKRKRNSKERKKDAVFFYK